MKHLYFCRHGLSELNKAGKWSGSSDTLLAAEGKEQAKLAGESAKVLQINYIICSPLSRAHSTAKIIAKQIGYPLGKIEVNSLVTERHFGALEGTAWHPDHNVDGISDAETVDSLMNRAHLTLEHLQTIEADTILLVAHGTFGRALRHVLEPEISFYDVERFENAKIVKLI